MTLPHIPRRLAGWLGLLLSATAVGSLVWGVLRANGWYFGTSRGSIWQLQAETRRLVVKDSVQDAALTTLRELINTRLEAMQRDTRSLVRLECERTAAVYRRLAELRCEP